MGKLTVVQQERLAALIEAMESLPTAERIVQSADLRCPRPAGESEKKRMRSALAGAFAAEKVMYYLEALRFTNRERNQLNYQIRALINAEKDALNRNGAEAVAAAQVERTMLSGMLEVMLHTFAVYSWRIAALLPVAARAASVKLEQSQGDVLNAYEGLRHHYEHRRTPPREEARR